MKLRTHKSPLYLAVLGCLITAVPAAPALAAPADAANATANKNANAAAKSAAKPSATEETPLTGAAWTAADLAYRAYAEGNFGAAIRYAKEAARLRPDVPRLQALIGYAEQAQRRGSAPAAAASSGSSADVALLKKLDALQAAEDYEVALALAEQGLRAPGSHSALAARAKQLRSQAAMQVTAKALRLEESGDLAAALAAIRSAPAYDPEAPQYRLLLVKLLNQNKDPEGAYAAARMALAIHSDDAMTQTYTAFLLQQKGERAQAQPLFLKALKSDELGDADLLNLRLIAADAALSAGDAAAAVQALAPLKDSDPDVRERRALANAITASTTRFRPTLVAPALRCVLNRFGPVCSLFAGSRPSQLMAAEAYRLQNEKRLPEALALVDEALRISGNSAEMAAQRKQVLGGMAREQAALAFKALADSDTALAQQALQKAIAYAPDVMAYRMMQIDILVQKKDYAHGESLATEAMRIDADDVTPRVMRGYLRQAQNNQDGAREDYRVALANKDLRDSDRLNVGLFVADALWAGGDAAEASAVLAKLPAENPQVRWRRRLTEDDRKRPALLAPTLDYRATPYDTVASIQPSLYATDTLVRAILRAMSDHDDEEAVSLARLLANSAPENQSYQRVFAMTLTEAGETREARQVREKLGTSVPNLDFAYMAQRVKASDMAAQAFKDIDMAGQLPDRALRDAGYAAMDANERRSASSYFKRAINAARDGEVPLKAQQLYDVRRTVEQLDRQWGGYVALNYRGASPESGPSNSGSGDSAQLGAEAYWRPNALNGNGRYVDFYGRINGTAYSKENGIATGAGSLLGAVGVRVKPLASQNVILAAERLLALGSKTEGDWLLRAAYSYGLGTDLRMGASAWTMAQVYAEAGRYLAAGTNYLTSEAQLGRSFRMASGWPKHTVLTPFVVLGADYNEGFLEREAIGAGVGVAYRYWFNEDRYTAPRSYFDLNLQYRARISGDDRAGGVVLRAVISR